MNFSIGDGFNLGMGFFIARFAWSMLTSLFTLFLVLISSPKKEG